MVLLMLALTKYALLASTEFSWLELKDFIGLAFIILFMLLPLSYFMYKLWISKSKKDISKLSSLMKIIMFF